MQDAIARNNDETEVNASVTEKTNLNPDIWLPRFIYECLPWFYLFAGIAAFFATLYINSWLWVVPHYVIFSACCLHISLVIIRRRRIARSKNAAPPEDTRTDNT